MSISFAPFAFQNSFCITFVLDMVSFSATVTKYRRLAHVAVMILQAIVAFDLVLIFQTLLVRMAFLSASVASKGFLVCWLFQKKSKVTMIYCTIHIAASLSIIFRRLFWIFFISFFVDFHNWEDSEDQFLLEYGLRDLTNFCLSSNRVQMETLFC